MRGADAGGLRCFWLNLSEIRIEEVRDVSTAVMVIVYVYIYLGSSFRTSSFVRISAAGRLALSRG